MDQLRNYVKTGFQDYKPHHIQLDLMVHQLRDCYHIQFLLNTLHRKFIWFAKPYRFIINCPIFQLELDHITFLLLGNSPFGFKGFSPAAISLQPYSYCVFQHYLRMVVEPFLFYILLSLFL